MASGDVVVHQTGPFSGTGTNYAQPTTLAGVSSPSEVVPVWAFDQTTAEYVDFGAELSGYAGGGLTFRLKYSAAVNANPVQWEIGVRRMADDAAGSDLDASHSYAFNLVSDTVPSSVNEIGYASITFTDGADMDSWATNELAIVRVRRNPDGTDSAAGDAYLWSVVGTET